MTTIRASISSQTTFPASFQLADRQEGRNLSQRASIIYTFADRVQDVCKPVFTASIVEMRNCNLSKRKVRKKSVRRLRKMASKPSVSGARMSKSIVP